MSRSVSVPSNAEVVAYQEFIYSEEADGQWEWEFFRERMIDQAQQWWPSFSPCDYWLGRENHAVLENGHAYFGLSEYCGVVSIWLVPKDDEGNLARAWCAKVARRFQDVFGELYLMGFFSNGEAAFQRRRRKEVAA